MTLGVGDIFTCIVPYCPASWYCVSKAMKTKAEKCIVSSLHIREQWSNGMILMKAVMEKKPEILNIFLRAKLKVPRTLLSHQIVAHILSYEYVRQALKPLGIIRYLEIAPDEVVACMDVRDVSVVRRGKDVTAYKTLMDFGRIFLETFKHLLLTIYTTLDLCDPISLIKVEDSLRLTGDVSR